MVNYTNISLKDRTETNRPQGRAYFIFKKVGKAIADYNMISDGDKIAVAVSGGKDSLSLLKILCERRSFVPINYEVVAIHIDRFAGNPRCLPCRQAGLLRDSKCFSTKCHRGIRMC